MLSKEENALLTQVSRGTVMGDLMRQYWIPFLSSNEIEADGRQMRIKLMNEDLIAFRDSSGRVGLLEEHCMHRSASLYFARNENNGLRCVYHGWMYDVSGKCIGMPNEPAWSNFKDKVQLVSYPCQERNGIIWTYLGPRETPPPLPDLEFNMLPPAHVLVWKNIQNTNWVQGLEVNIDSSHLSFLHTRLTADGSAEFGGPGGRGLWLTDPTPRMEVMDTDYGVMYGSGRQGGARQDLLACDPVHDALLRAVRSHRAARVPDAVVGAARRSHGDEVRCALEPAAPAHGGGARPPADGGARRLSRADLGSVFALAARGESGERLLRRLERRGGEALLRRADGESPGRRGARLDVVHRQPCPGASRHLRCHGHPHAAQAARSGQGAA
jgi:nitrite reductase/ring-hydroxylating ferredoxin subunit